MKGQICLRGCWGSGPHLLSCILDTMASEWEGDSNCLSRSMNLMMCFAKLVSYLEALVCIKERNDGFYEKTARRHNKKDRKRQKWGRSINPISEIVTNLWKRSSQHGWTDVSTRCSPWQPRPPSTPGRGVSLEAIYFSILLHQDTPISLPGHIRAEF